MTLTDGWRTLPFGPVKVHSPTTTTVSPSVTIRSMSKLTSGARVTASWLE